MKTGADLIKDIDERYVPFGALCFWWLGQLSFVVKTQRAVLYLDPFLSPLEGRRVPPLLQPEDVTNADVITGSHDHADHIDHGALPGLMAASPRSILVAPRPTGAVLERIGLPMSRVRLLDDGQVLEEKGVRVTAIKAAHELFDHSVAYGYPYLGYVIEADGVTIYHAGDTCVYDGLATRLRAWSIAVAFLPINGRDARRLRAGCIGNMTYQEAVDLAGTIQPRLTVPSHYEMFAMNTADPVLFADYMDVKFPGLRYWIGRHGEGVEVGL